MIGTLGGRPARAGTMVAAALLCLGAVTACGSEAPEPEEKEWADSEDSEQPNDGADETSEDGSDENGSDEAADPESFATEYVDAMNEAMKTGDGTQLRELGTEDCESCNGMADYQEEIHGNGGGYQDDPSYQDIELVEGPEEGDELTWLRLSMTQPEVEKQEDEGGNAETVGGSEEFTDFGLLQQEGRWKVAQFCTVTEGQPELGCPGA